MNVKEAEMPVVTVIGFTGRRGCGKDTAAAYLEERHGFRMLDFTRDVLAPELVRDRVPVTRENLIRLAMDGRKKANDGIWAEKLADIIGRGGPGSFVISGIRFRDEARVFRERFGPGFSLVAILCPDQQRYERVIRRGTKGEGSLSFAEFMAVEERPTEMAIGMAMEDADFLIDNGGTRGELQSALDRLVKVIKATPDK